MNTRIIPIEYKYEAPATLVEALEILAKRKNVKVLAGGTDLVVKMKTGAISEMDTMLDIKRIEELNHITIDKAAGVIKIGAATVLSDIEDNAEVAAALPALHEALVAMAAIAVRHMGTIGGNFANASPVADTAGPVMAHGGSVKLASVAGERIVPACEFFHGLGKSELKADELIVEFILPIAPANVGSAFIKKTRVKADISKISTTVCMMLDDNKITAMNIAMGAVAIKPILMNEVCAKYIGTEATAANFALIAADISDAINPIDDIRSTAEYRKAVAEVIVADALALAAKRAGGAK